MRAATTLQGLARACKLTTVVVPVCQPQADRTALHWAAERSHDCILVKLPKPGEAARNWLSDADSRHLVEMLQPLPQLVRLADSTCVRQTLGNVSFDLVWVQRQYLAPAAYPFLGAANYRFLDLDENDCTTLHAIADLQKRRGEAAAATRMADEADAYERLMAHCLPWFDEVAVSSDSEAAALRSSDKMKTRLLTISNAVKRQTSHVNTGKSADPLRLVFVGNMDYLPNMDAAERLAVAILPALRLHFPTTELHIAGAGRGADSICELPGVHVHGFVPDLTEIYQRATVVVAPLRAGGGTRLKLLEAFAHRVPVVATPMAAAGLEVRDNEQLLIAPDNEGIVTAILNIAHDIHLGLRLADTAAEFVAERHDVDQVAEKIGFSVLSRLRKTASQNDEQHNLPSHTRPGSP